MSNIVIIWDSMIDKYIYGNTDKKNPESPMPLLKVEKEEESIEEIITSQIEEKENN